MIAIALTVNDDQSITVDYWGPRLNVARALRIDDWDLVLRAWEEKGNTLTFDPHAIRTLFCDLRIDAKRAHLMLDAQGDTSVTTIDPIPEEAPQGANQLVEDEIHNERVILDVLRERHAITSIALGHKPHADLWIATMEALRDEGKLRPGLRGL